MKLLDTIKRRERLMDLTTKIRYYYVLLFIPVMILVGICIFNMWDSNQEYGRLIETAETASQFSLDFKREFDYEVYLLVIEKNEPDDSEVFEMLNNADEVVKTLDETTKNLTTQMRLEGVKGYLAELRVYVEQIIVNQLEYEDSYPVNYKLWEESVKVNTALLKENITQITNLELQGLQKRRAEFQQSYLDVIRYSGIALIILTILTILFSIYVPRTISKPVRELVEVTNRVASGDLKIRSQVEGGTEITMLNDSMNVMIEKLNGLIEQVKDEQKQLRMAEFKVLQEQINPHFLYNTLDTIVWLAEAGDQKKVVSMVGSLSEFFRTSLNQGKDIITLSEELQHVRSYLEIQQIRYQDILTYQIEVSNEFGFVSIPKITLQPLIENALYHGIKNKRGGGKIVVTAEADEDYLIIKVSDNGIGMSEEVLQKVRKSINDNGESAHSSYGLYNVNERIRLNFGTEYGLRLESIFGEGTTAFVVLPLKVRSEANVHDLIG